MSMYSTSDMDAIFNGATVAVTGVQNIANAVADTVNGVRGIMDNNSRRNITPQAQPTYTQPIAYGYGYEDSPYNNNMMSTYPTSQQMVGGYPGFTNPMYGVGTSSPTATYSSQTNYNYNYNNNIPKGDAWG